MDTQSLEVTNTILEDKSCKSNKDFGLNSPKYEKLRYTKDADEDKKMFGSENNCDENNQSHCREPNKQMLDLMETQLVCTSIQSQGTYDFKSDDKKTSFKTSSHINEYLVNRKCHNQQTNSSVDVDAFTSLNKELQSKASNSSDKSETEVDNKKLANSSSSFMEQNKTLNTKDLFKDSGKYSSDHSNENNDAENFEDFKFEDTNIDKKNKENAADQSLILKSEKENDLYKSNKKGTKAELLKKDCNENQDKSCNIDFDKISSPVKKQIDFNETMNNLKADTENENRQQVVKLSAHNVELNSYKQETEVNNATEGLKTETDIQKNTNALEKVKIIDDLNGTINDNKPSLVNEQVKDSSNDSHTIMERHEMDYPNDFRNKFDRLRTKRETDFDVQTLNNEKFIDDQTCLTPKKNAKEIINFDDVSDEKQESEERNISIEAEQEEENKNRVKNDETEVRIIAKKQIERSNELDQNQQTDVNEEETRAFIARQNVSTALNIVAAGLADAIHNLGVEKSADISCCESKTEATTDKPNLNTTILYINNNYKTNTNLLRENDDYIEIGEAGTEERIYENQKNLKSYDIIDVEEKTATQENHKNMTKEGRTNDNNSLGEEIVCSKTDSIHIFAKKTKQTESKEKNNENKSDQIQENRQNQSKDVTAENNYEILKNKSEINSSFNKINFQQFETGYEICSTSEKGEPFKIKESTICGQVDKKLETRDKHFDKQYNQEFINNKFQFKSKENIFETDFDNKICLATDAERTEMKSKIKIDLNQENIENNTKEKIKNKVLFDELKDLKSALINDGEELNGRIHNSKATTNFEENFSLSNEYDKLKEVESNKNIDMGEGNEIKMHKISLIDSCQVNLNSDETNYIKCETDESNHYVKKYIPANSDNQPNKSDKIKHKCTEYKNQENLQSSNSINEEVRDYDDSTKEIIENSVAKKINTKEKQSFTKNQNKFTDSCNDISQDNTDIEEDSNYPLTTNESNLNNATFNQNKNHNEILSATERHETYEKAEVEPSDLSYKDIYVKKLNVTKFINKNQSTDSINENITVDDIKNHKTEIKSDETFKSKNINLIQTTENCNPFATVIEQNIADAQIEGNNTDKHNFEQNHAYIYEEQENSIADHILNKIEIGNNAKEKDTNEEAVKYISIPDKNIIDEQLKSTAEKKNIISDPQHNEINDNENICDLNSKTDRQADDNTILAIEEDTDEANGLLSHTDIQAKTENENNFIYSAKQPLENDDKRESKGNNFKDKTKSEYIIANYKVPYIAIPTNRKDMIIMKGKEPVLQDTDKSKQKTVDINQEEMVSNENKNTIDEISSELHQAELQTVYSSESTETIEDNVQVPANEDSVLNEKNFKKNCNKNIYIAKDLINQTKTIFLNKTQEDDSHNAEAMIKKYEIQMYPENTEALTREVENSNDTDNNESDLMCNKCTERDYDTLQKSDLIIENATLSPLNNLDMYAVEFKKYENKCDGITETVCENTLINESKTKFIELEENPSELLAILGKTINETNEMQHSIGQIYTKSSKTIENEDFEKLALNDKIGRQYYERKNEINTIIAEEPEKIIEENKCKDKYLELQNQPDDNVNIKSSDNNNEEKLNVSEEKLKLNNEDIKLDFLEIADNKINGIPQENLYDKENIKEVLSKEEASEVAKATSNSSARCNNNVLEYLNQKVYNYKINDGNETPDVGDSKGNTSNQATTLSIGNETPEFLIGNQNLSFDRIRFCNEGLRGSISGGRFAETHLRSFWKEYILNNSKPLSQYDSLISETYIKHDKRPKSTNDESALIKEAITELEVMQIESHVIFNNKDLERIPTYFYGIPEPIEDDTTNMCKPKNYKKAMAFTISIDDINKKHISKTNERKELEKTLLNKENKMKLPQDASNTVSKNIDINSYVHDELLLAAEPTAKFFQDISQFEYHIQNNGLKNDSGKKSDENDENVNDINGYSLKPQPILQTISELSESESPRPLEELEPNDEHIFINLDENSDTVTDLRVDKSIMLDEYQTISLMNFKDQNKIKDDILLNNEQIIAITISDNLFINDNLKEFAAKKIQNIYRQYLKNKKKKNISTNAKTNEDANSEKIANKCKIIIGSINLKNKNNHLPMYGSDLKDISKKNNVDDNNVGKSLNYNKVNSADIRVKAQNNNTNEINLFGKVSTRSNDNPRDSLNKNFNIEIYQEATASKEDDIPLTKSMISQNKAAEIIQKFLKKYIKPKSTLNIRSDLLKSHWYTGDEPIILNQVPSDLPKTKTEFFFEETEAYIELAANSPKYLVNSSSLEPVRTNDMPRATAVPENNRNSSSSSDNVELLAGNSINPSKEKISVNDCGYTKDMDWMPTRGLNRSQQNERTIRYTNLINDFIKSERHYSDVVNQKYFKSDFADIQLCPPSICEISKILSDFSQIEYTQSEIPFKKSEELCTKESIRDKNKITYISLSSSSDIDDIEDSLSTKTVKLQEPEKAITKMQRRRGSTSKITYLDNLNDYYFDEPSIVPIMNLVTDEEGFAVTELQGDKSSKNTGQNDSDFVVETFVKEDSSDSQENFDFGPTLSPKGSLKHAYTIDGEAKANAAKSDVCDKTLNNIINTSSDLSTKKFDDFYVRRALIVNGDTSTETQSAIVSAVTKIQAVTRGYLTRKNLSKKVKSITHTSSNKEPFGNSTISESLEYLVQKAAAKKIQNAYKNYYRNKCASTSQEKSSTLSDEYSKIIETTLAQKRSTMLQRGDALQNVPSPEEVISSNNRSESENGVVIGKIDYKISTILLSSAKSAAAIQNKKIEDNKRRWMAIRQNSMPVQIDSEVLRVIPKYIRKNVKSAEGEKRKERKRLFMN